MSACWHVVTPITWSVVELGSLVGVSYGKALSASMRAEEGEIPVIGSSGVVGRHNQELVDGPCIVVGRKGAAGAVHLIGQSSWPIDTAYFIQPPPGVDLRYLYFFLSSQQLGQLDKSTAIPSLSRDDLYKVEVPVAPRSEQTRIVGKLEELLSDLDAGVAELKAAQRKLVQYRQSLLKAAVEGALTADWRAARAQTGEPQESGTELLQRILNERRARWEASQLARFAEQGKISPKDWQAKYKEPVALETTDAHSLPEGWAWTSLGQCFHVAVGATPSRKESSYWGDGIPWVSSGEVRFNRISAAREQITEEGLNNTSTQINPIGSVLLGMIGEGKTRGQVAILDIGAANNQNCAAVWVSETDVPPEYVYYWLWSRYEETRRGSSGNNQPALNKAIVERIPCPLPPLDEINEIVSQVEFSLQQSNQQETAITRSLKQSAAQRKNILKAAFTGQLVPQDPNDEPASLLLERIRAERSAEGSAITRKRGRKAKESA